MFYGILGAIAMIAPVTYLLVCDVKNRNRIKNLQEQVSILKSNLSKNNDEIAFLKTSSDGSVALKILKENSKRLSLSHAFKS